VKPGLSARLKLRQWRWKPESAVNRSVIQVGISGCSVSNTDLDVPGTLLIEGTLFSLVTVAPVHVSKVVCDVAGESSRRRPILTAASMGPERCCSLLTYILRSASTSDGSLTLNVAKLLRLSSIDLGFWTCRWQTVGNASIFFRSAIVGLNMA